MDKSSHLSEEVEGMEHLHTHCYPCVHIITSCSYGRYLALMNT